MSGFIVPQDLQKFKHFFMQIASYPFAPARRGCDILQFLENSPFLIYIPRPFVVQ